ncbi:MAG: DUF2062 domain-containing protein [Lysobacterales bacterium]
MRHEYDRLLRQWLLRRKRLRRLLRPLPRRGNLHRYPVIKWFAEHARKRPFLWSFKRAQVIPALYWGSVISLLPLYGVQLIIAFAAALAFRGNLTIMVALQFITNPLTVVPIYATTAWVGANLMRFLQIGEHLPKAVFYANALFIGGVVVGLIVALMADLLWRFIDWESRLFKARLQHLHRIVHPPAEPVTPSDDSKTP